MEPDHPFCLRMRMGICMRRYKMHRAYLSYTLAAYMRSMGTKLRSFMASARTSRVQM